MANFCIRDVFIDDELLAIIEHNQSLMNKNDLMSKVKKGYTLKTFFKDEFLIGYALYTNLSKLNLSSFFDDVDNFSDVKLYRREIKEKYSNAICLDSFEIFSCFRNQKLGKLFFNELFINQDIFLYSLSESMDFWYTVGFDLFNNESYYMIRTSNLRNQDILKRVV